MYTTDEIYQREQCESARQTIARAAGRYLSPTHRLAELEWWRSVYQAFGDWQIAIDLLKEKGGLLEQFNLVLQQSTVTHTKGVWDEEDYAVHGKARAYSEARYAVRFLPVTQAIRALECIRQIILDTPESDCSETEVMKLKATATELGNVIDLLRA